MKTERFLEALNEINDKYIEQVRCYKMKKKITITKIVAAAACVALMVGMIPLVNHFTGIPVDGTTGDILQTGTTGSLEPLPTIIKVGENGKYTAYDRGPHEGSNRLDAEHSMEFQAEGLKYVYDKTKENEKKKIEVNGKTYEGVYMTTIESPRYNDDTDMYVIRENGKVMYSFEINKTTGMVTSFYNAYAYDRLLENVFREKECYAIAKDFIKTIIDDFDEFELVESAEATWGKAYNFTFCRVLDGIETSEKINVGITGEGDIYSYMIVSYGSMDNVDVSAIKMEDIDKVISDKVAMIYKKNPDVTYVAKILSLIRLKDGTFYIDCDLKMQGVNSKTGKVCYESCYIAVTID